MLNLPKPDLAPVYFRRELPEWLANGEKCYIEIDAKAGGIANPEWMARFEESLTRAKIADEKSKGITDIEEKVRARRRDHRDAALRRFADLYDTCINSWHSNMLNDGKPIECNRENFLLLCNLRGYPEVERAITDFEQECILYGKSLIEEDQEAVKN